MKNSHFYFVLSKKCTTFAPDFDNRREVAQLVSVRVWGARGRQFESGLPDQSSKRVNRLLLFYGQTIKWYNSLFLYLFLEKNVGKVWKLYILLLIFEI